jgi:hypothetical protein
VWWWAEVRLVFDSVVQSVLSVLWVPVVSPVAWPTVGVQMVSVKVVALQAVLRVTVVVGARVLKTVVHRVAVVVLLPLHVVVVAVVV